MTSGFLAPPNSFSLSDLATDDVVLRAGSLRSRLGLTNERESREVDRYTKPRQTFNSSAVAKLPPSRTIGRKRLQLDDLANVASQRSGGSTPSTATQLPPMPPAISRRERCRINQARYRKRQRQCADDLEASTRQLQEEIQELETQHQNAMRLSKTNESVWIVAAEYFRLFRFGYMVPPESPFKKTDAQLDFLRTSMASDVTDGGVDAILEHWKLPSLYGGNVQVRLERLEQVGVDSLLATTATSVTLTEDTLRHVFPHLLEGEAASKLSSLADKLKNKRLVLRGSVRFDWDAVACRVARLESEVDLLTPTLRLLGSLEDVARVFEQALVTLDGKFIACN